MIASFYLDLAVDSLIYMWKWSSISSLLFIYTSSFTILNLYFSTAHFVDESDFWAHIIVEAIQYHTESGKTLLPHQMSFN